MSMAMWNILIRCYNKHIFKAGTLELFPSRGYAGNLFKPPPVGA